jgi:alpha-1,3-glucan synthase
MKWSLASGLVSLLVTTVTAWPYDEAYLDYNINTNKTATNPADYWGTWPGHEGKYFPSPDNWRFPFYSMFLDRFVNGDPTNDNANGTTFEHDIEHRIRHGGDVAGLVDTGLSPRNGNQGLSHLNCLMARKYMLTMSRVSISREPPC